MTNSYTLANNFLVETALPLDPQSLDTLGQDLLKLQEKLFTLANNLDYKQLLDEFKQLDEKFQQLNPNLGAEKLRITYLGDLDLSAVINSLASSLGLAKPLTNALLVSNPSIRIEGHANDRKIELAVSQLPVDGLIALFSTLAGGVLPDEILNTLKSVGDKLDKLEFVLLEDKLSIRYQDSLNFSISLGDLVGGSPPFVSDAISAITKTIFDSESSNILKLTIKNPEISVATGPEVELSGGFKAGKISVNYDKQKDLSLSYELPNAIDFSKLADKIPVLREFKLSEPEIIISSTAGQINDPKLGTINLIEGFNFLGNINFKDASDQFSRFISGKLGIENLGVLVGLGSNGASLTAVVPLDVTLFSEGNFRSLLKNVQLLLVVDGSPKPTFGLKGNLELSGYDPFQSNEPTLLLSGNVNLDLASVTAGFALQTGSQPWVNPFGIPDTQIRNLALQIGATYQPPFVDNVGFLGDFLFGNYDLKVALSIDIYDPDNIALFLKTNRPLTLVDLLTGPVGSFALKQVGDEIPIIDKTLDLLDTILDVNVSGLDVNNDGEVEPLIQFVPFKTDIAGIPVEEGFGINAQVDAYGVKGKLVLNADKDLSEITGSLAVPKIDLGGLGVIVIQGKNDSELNLDVRLDANPLSLPTISGDASIKLFGSELLGAEFKVGRNDVKIKGIRTIPGVLTLAADFSASNITNSNLNFNGSGNLSVFGNPITNATISGDSKSFAATGNLTLLGIPNILQGNAIATVTLGTTPNDFALSGGGKLSIFNNLLANASFSGDSKKITAKGTLDLKVANVFSGNVDAEVSIKNNSNFTLAANGNLKILDKDFSKVSLNGNNKNLAFGASNSFSTPFGSAASNLSAILDQKGLDLDGQLTVNLPSFKVAGLNIQALKVSASPDLNIAKNGRISGGINGISFSALGINFPKFNINVGNINGLDSWDDLVGKIKDDVIKKVQSKASSLFPIPSISISKNGLDVKVGVGNIAKTSTSIGKNGISAGASIGNVKASASAGKNGISAAVNVGKTDVSASVGKKGVNLKVGGVSASFRWGDIEGATVWLDSNGNKRFDPEEPNTITNADGTYFLEIPDEFSSSTGLVLAQGGIDTSTGLANPILSSALLGGNSTPLTALIQQFVAGGKSIDDSLAQVQSAFGISPDIDLFEFDHVDEALNANPEARAVLLSIANLGSITIEVQDFLAGAGGSTVTGLDPIVNSVLSEAIYAAIASQVANGNLSLENVDQLEAIIRKAAVSAQEALQTRGISFNINLSIVDRVANDAARILAAGSTKKRLLSEEATDGLELLTRVTQAKRISNGNEANALNLLGKEQLSEAQISALTDTSEIALKSIRAVALPPQLVGLTDILLAEGQQLADFPITVYDIETPQDQLIINITSDNEELLPAGNVLLIPGDNKYTRFLNISPLAGLTGNATIKISVTDSDGNTIDQAFVVSVETNKAPIFLSTGSFSVSSSAENGTVIGNLDANDGNDGITDISIGYSIISGNDDLDGDGSRPFDIDLNGEIFVNDQDDLVIAGSGTQFNLTVVAADSDMESTAQVSITVDPQINNAPVAEPDKTLTLLEDAATSLNIAAPTDIDGDTLTILINTIPDSSKGAIRLSDGTAVTAGQSLTLAQLTSLTFAPSANANGSAGSFSYTVSDGQGGSASQTVAITITPDGNGGSWGDPHIFTFDQFHYDFQATGDFVLVRALDSDLEVQVRQTPWDKNLATTINTGLATLVDGNRLEFYVDRPLPLVNNKALSIQPGETLALGQGSISRTSITGYGMQGDLYTVTYPNGDVLLNKVFSGFLIDPTLDLANSHNVVGLLGNNNGNASDDLALSNGTILSTSPDLDTLYGAFADSWRVSDTQSFFSPIVSTPPLNLSQSDLNLQNDLDRVIQQLVVGGNDNDTLIGVTDSLINPGKGEIDLFMGNKGADTFVLGDQNNRYYVGLGQQDYALITDLWAEDKIQLHGSASDYVLGSAPSKLANGTGIFLASDPNELIGIIQGDQMTNLNLSNRSMFEYV
jgi:hypothetical protein